MDQLPEKFPRKIIRGKDYGQSSIDAATYVSDSMFDVLLHEAYEYHIPMNEKTKILEVGSGDATMLNLAKENGLNVVGVDAKPRGESKSQVLARVEQLPFADNSFDIVFSGGVFDPNIYEQNPSLMMKEIKRVLKVGGIYVGFEPFMRRTPELKDESWVKRHGGVFQKTG